MFAVCTRTKRSYSHASVERIVWHRDKIQDFTENIQGERFKEKIAHATEEIDQCIDKALGELTDCLMNASACVRKKQTVGNTRQGGSVWFETECHKKIVISKKTSCSHRLRDNTTVTQNRADDVTRSLTR